MSRPRKAKDRTRQRSRRATCRISWHKPSLPGRRRKCIPNRFVPGHSMRRRINHPKPGLRSRQRRIGLRHRHLQPSSTQHPLSGPNITRRRKKRNIRTSHGESQVQVGTADSAKNSGFSAFIAQQTTLSDY